MTAPIFDGAARVAGVVGSPVRQSLSPLIHNAWIAAASLDAVYIPLCPAPHRFAALIDGLRGGSIVGLNVTLPFKVEALRLADCADGAARSAGAANLLVFHTDGAVEARNTDGIGLLRAFAEQAPDWSPEAGPVLVLGAGGAARGAVAALHAAGAVVRVANRTPARVHALADAFAGVEVAGLDDLTAAVAGVSAIVNATAAGLEGEGTLDLPWGAVAPRAVVMDMVYKPLHTALLCQARAAGLATVDGLAMLIGQAAPSFHAFFGQPPPPRVDVRALALAALGEGP
jgi:shikimate dehydrogenase